MFYTFIWLDSVFDHKFVLNHKIWEKIKWELLYISNDFCLCSGWYFSRCPTVSCHSPTDPQSGRWTRQDVSTPHTYSHTHEELRLSGSSLCGQSLWVCVQVWVSGFGSCDQSQTAHEVFEGGKHTHTHTHIMAPSCTLLSIALVFTPLNPLTHTHTAPYYR